MSLGSDEPNCHNSYTNNSTKKKLGRFGIWEVLQLKKKELPCPVCCIVVISAYGIVANQRPKLPSFVSVLLFVQELWQLGLSVPRPIRNYTFVTLLDIFRKLLFQNLCGMYVHDTWGCQGVGQVVHVHGWESAFHNE